MSPPFPFDDPSPSLRVTLVDLNGVLSLLLRGIRLLVLSNISIFLNWVVLPGETLARALVM